ncbi:GGDEF domain-containing protein [Cohnella caldifontis]|uniref:GGDEF domain-containing protein n=1 Tax=Cohnella caldifontis TaxID=3027471 RepID=UPI0023ECEAC0|nr:GGDEF domain-containing protein [Cohnella sp. YIM B05605]
MSLPPMEFNQKRWNRLLLQGYWVLSLVTVGVELLYMYFVSNETKSEFLSRYVLLPTLLTTAVVGSAELAIRKMHAKSHDYILITASALLAFIVSAVHASLNYLLFFLFFPIMISIFYFQYKKLAYAIANTLAALIVLYVFNPAIHDRISFVGLITMTVLLAVYSVIAFGVLTRGREALQHLRSTYESNQELLVRTIMMDKLAKTDALTNTYNHMAYHEYVEKLVEQADNGRLKLQIAVLDIDNFKKVNDTYGHRAGDAVLREVAAIARAQVGPNDFVARYGGEEFVILFTEIDVSHAYQIAEEIRETVSQTTHEALNGMAVTVSIGINRYRPGMGKERLFQGADAALYEAKKTGKNRTVLAEGVPAGFGQETASAMS